MAPQSADEALVNLSLGDFAGMLSAVALIFSVALVNGHGRIFWEDETLGWMLLKDPSWSHMLRAWRLGADGGGIFFYVLGRAWFHVFGNSVTAFRLFSATGFGLAVPLLWASLRRWYSVGIVAFAVFNTLFFSPTLTMHYMEGRFYGLLMFSTALALYTTLKLDSCKDPLPRRWYAYVFGTHLLLTGSHVLGVVYSASFILAIVLLDRIRGRRRPLLYLAMSASWLLLFWERTALIATAQVGKPHFWTKAPGLGQMIGGWCVYSPEIFLVLLVLSVSVVATLPPSPTQQKAEIARNVRERTGIYVVGGCILLIPLAFLLEGLVGTWLFTDRYLQPVALGVACLTAELCWCVLRGARSEGGRRQDGLLPKIAASGFAALFAVALIFWVFFKQAAYTPSVPDFTLQLTRNIPPGLPVVVEDAFTFTDLVSRPSGSLRDYNFLLNWDYALSPQAQRAEVTQYHLMQNWRRSGYYSRQIEDEATFLRKHDRFVVISNSILGTKPLERPETGNPIAQRLSSSSEYCVRPLYILDRLFRDSQRDVVWLVSHEQCPAPSGTSGEGMKPGL